MLNTHKDCSVKYVSQWNLIYSKRDNKLQQKNDNLGQNIIEFKPFRYIDWQIGNMKNQIRSEHRN